MTHRRTRMWRSLLGSLAALALVATSCGGGSSDAVVETADAAADTPAAPAAAAGAETSAASPQSSIIASTVAGGQIDFGSLEGQDVVLWFWAPW